MLILLKIKGNNARLRNFYYNLLKSIAMAMSKLGKRPIGWGLVTLLIGIVALIGLGDVIDAELFGLQSDH